MMRMKRYVALLVAEIFFASNLTIPMVGGVAASPTAHEITRTRIYGTVDAQTAGSGSGTADGSAEAPASAVISREVTPESGGRLELEGAVLEIPPGAVEKPLVISVRTLPVSAALGDEMANVTSGAQAFRFEPHGTRFLQPVNVSLPFDRAMLGSETALSNLFTYFYDEWAGQWVRLERLEIDREEARVVSSTTHFTDMVNATLKLPEGPSPVSFDVNSIKNLEAADPSNGVPMLEGLDGGSQGSASFNIPLRLPKGRGGSTPELALSYSSEIPNSWLGRGFDISAPSITTDTKFGLPRYDGNDAYVLAGERLIEAATEAEGVRYKPLTERLFQRILRRQDGSGTYWEVTDKSGTVSEYGRGEGWIGPLRSDRTRVFTWYLTKARDAFGNTAEYSYWYDDVNACTYLAEIRYSGFEGAGAPDDAAYRIVFRLQDADRPDRRMDSRGKFSSKLAKLLAGVDVYYRGGLIRSYVPAYAANVFGQSQLESWTETDAAGTPFYTYAFTYNGLDVSADGYSGFGDEVDWSIPSADKPLASTSSSSVGANLYAGLEFFIWIPFVGTISLASLGITGGYNYTSSMSLGSLLDVNGDGLPDIAWKSGDTLQAYLNQGGAFVGSFGVTGLSGSLDKESQHTVSVGGSAGLAGVSAGVSYQHSWSDSSTGFADVNGDGFIDFVTKGQGQFGLNNGLSLPGQMALVQTNWAMPADPPSGVPAANTLDADNYKRVYYQQEPVRKWRAYRSGTVRVEQTGRLIYPDSASLDGVQLYTYSDASSGVISLSRGAPNPDPSSATYSVDRDDPLYFHVETGESERLDDVYWDVRISYSSVKFFEGLDVVEFMPPASQPGVSALAPIYDDVSGTLESTWQELPYSTLQPVYEALAEHAYFIPNRIAKADMDRIVEACKDEPDQTRTVDPDGPGPQGTQNVSIPAEKILLTGYRYVNETQMLYRVGAEGDALMASQLPQAFPYADAERRADLRRIASYGWMDGSRVYARQTGSEYSVQSSAPAMTADAHIMADAAGAAAGETVWPNGILLDRLWSADASPALLESVWLGKNALGNWELYVQGGDPGNPPTQLSVTPKGTDALSVSFMDRGVRRAFELAGRSYSIAQMCAGEYDGPVTAAILGDETFAANGCQTVPAAALEEIVADVLVIDADDADFINACYDLDGDSYVLVAGLSDSDYHILIGLLDPFIRQTGSIFDVFAGESVDRFVRLDQAEYQSFIAGQPASITNCFEYYTDGSLTFYHPVRGLSAVQADELEAAMRVFRRDTELFPYYTTDAGAGVRTLKTPTAPQAAQDILKAGDVCVYASIARSINYVTGGSFPVTTPAVPPSGAVEELDAPRGALSAVPGAQVGIVDIMCFDALYRTTFTRRYLHVFDAEDDFSTQNLVQKIDPDPPAPEPPEPAPEPDPYLACSGENESFHGGVWGWYYGAWIGYHDWDVLKIGTMPDQPAQTEPDPDPEMDPNLTPAPAVIPPYFEAMDPNIDIGNGSRAVESEGKSGIELEDAWIGKVSNASEPVMDDQTGQTTSANFTYASYIAGATLHPSRKGGDAYFQIPVNAGSGNPQSLSFIRSSESEAVDINGGLTIGPVGGNISWNTGSSWQDLGLLDLNGDRYPDLLDFGSYGGSFKLYPGTGITGGSAGFGDAQSWSTPFSDISSFKTSAVGFGASVSASAGGIKVERDDSGKPRFVQIKEPGGGGSLGANGTVGATYQTVGFFDMNGDGLPDHVQRNGTGNFFVALNLGNGSFSSSLADWGSGITTPGNLLDVVDALTSQPEGLTHTSTGSFGATVGLTLDAAVLGVGVSAGFTGTVNQTYENLVDVNGDGLPDQVVKLKDDDFFRVKFNLGDRFQDTTTNLYRPDWQSYDPAGLRNAVSTDLGNIVSNLSGVPVPEGGTIPGYTGLPADSANGFSSALDPFRVDDVLSYNTGIAFSLGANLTVRITFPLLAITLKAGVDGSWATTSATLDFTDVDGDGLPDHVMKLPYENIVRVKPNVLGKVGLLKSVTLPQGGTYEVEYERAGNTVPMPQSQWVLSAVTRNDGVAGLSTDRGAHSYRTEYDYSDGYYNRGKREFCGFERVDTRYKNGTADIAVQSVWYHVRDFYRRGMEYRREIAEPVGGVLRLLSRTDTEIQPQSEGTYGVFEVLFPKTFSETQRLYDAASGEYTETRTVYRYDRDLMQPSYGNVVRIEEAGDTAVDGDELTVQIDYANLSGYFKQHPNHIRVYGAGDVLLREREVEEGGYGASGELLRLTQYESRSVGRDCTMTWDPYGNMASMRDPRGYTVSWTYDDDVHSFAVSSTSSNPSVPGTDSYSSSSTWDPRFGMETSRTDINNKTMTFAHDDFGRPTEARSPYDDAAGLPAVSYQYHTTGVPWYAVTANKVSFDPDDDQTITTVQSVDGLGRLLQTAKQSEVWEDGVRRAGWNLSGAVAYDSKGRTVKEGQTVFGEGTAITTALAAMTAETQKEYDGLDRVVRTILPDPDPDPDPLQKDTITQEYFIRDGRQVEKTSDPRGSIAERILDGRRNIVEVLRRDADQTVLTGARFSYNAMGDILEVTDRASNVTRSTYDLLGRRKSFQSPDAGTVEYEYDESGNMSRKTDSVMRTRGQSIRYVYDGLNRLIRIDYPRSVDVQYAYGAPGAAGGGAGRIVGLVDGSGSLSYRYGMLGETVEVTRSINRLTPGAADESATMTYAYDYLGRMQRITYPDAETVTYAYDYGGQVMSVTGDHYLRQTVYVEEVGYNESGQQVYIKYGNGLETRYQYDPGRSWLESVDTVTGSGAVYQTMRYAFDSLGNVTDVSNAGTTITGSENTLDHYETAAHYEYDALYQLVHAQATLATQKNGLPNYTSSYTQDFSFNSIGGLTSKISTLDTNPQKTIGAELNYELDYAYYAGRAHQVERVGNMWYRYDANGNMTEERQGGHSALPTSDAELSLVGDVRVANRGFGLPTGEPPGSSIYQRNFTWNEENRLTRSADATSSVDYRYGADGNRTLKYSEGGETMYFDPMWQATTVLSDIRQSKHVYMGTARIATRCNIKGFVDPGYEELNTFYYHPDHLGSAQLVTDPAGKKYEHMEYTPYGELWMEETTEAVSKTPFRFTAKEMDEETGLYYFGARYMNPRTGMWISADPAMEQYLPAAPVDGEARNLNANLPGMGGAFNPVNLAAYHYSGNNPIRFIDPNGNDYTPYTSPGFDTMDEAAIDVIRHVNETSIEENVEIGGRIYYSAADKKYHAEAPQRGDVGGFKMSTASLGEGNAQVGDYHTHGTYFQNGGYKNQLPLLIPCKREEMDDPASLETFSGLSDACKQPNADVPSIIRTAKASSDPASYRAYLGTPDRKVKKFDPSYQKGRLPMWLYNFLRVSTIGNTPKKK